VFMDAIERPERSAYESRATGKDQH
jgi:hypothetical protein